MPETSASEVTVVGQGARIEGTLVSAGSLRIDGQVKGKVSAEGDVGLSAQSRVEADVTAQNVTVGGQLRGNIVAKGKAELVRGGKVEGNITARTLVIAEGALFSGQSIMGEAAQQAKPAAAAPPKADQSGEPAPEPARA